ncbi:hypothetical protein GCM10023219_12800 [Stakelama sediminis]|uniref:Flagellar hook-associated protein 3 FlgL n=1 Tax=Stakelama sediminis TaxID=463200 RepID=A0A840YWU4_9SPHN|nr:flagellar hook-associated protein FlgL [Stakelama sediminis]MBB5718006.1 flagellar hook-associated protein 3 FlgL [Stakelama sediminis]
MRIATSQFYDRSTSQIQSLNAEADKLQTQIATGKKLTGASDDSVAWTQLATLKRASANDTAYSANIKLAQGVLSQTDSTLGSINTQLQRANELMVQANSGTLSQDQLQSVASSLDGIVDELVSLSNSTDLRGQPLFGGSDSNAPYVKNADGTVSYVSSGNAPSIPIGDSDNVQVSVNGASVFGGDGGSTPDMFKTITDFAAAIRSGGDLSGPASTAIDGIQASINSVTNAQAVAGARAARVDQASTRMTTTATTRETLRSGLEDTDVTSAITELQKTLTVLQATQTSFSKLSGLSLFNYLN